MQFNLCYRRNFPHRIPSPTFPVLFLTLFALLHAQHFNVSPPIPLFHYIMPHYHPLQHLPYVIDEWSFPWVFPAFSRSFPPCQRARFVTFWLCGVIFVALEIRLIGSSTQLEIVSPHSPGPLFRACRRFTLWLLIFTAWPSNLQQLWACPRAGR